MKELIEIQKKIKAPKNQLNKFGGYKYRSAEDIIASAKPLLKEQGCLLLMNDEIVVHEGRYYVKAEAKLINSESQEINTVAFARETESKKGMDAAQVTGATSSYARKYALNGLFALDDNEAIDSGTHPDAKETEKDYVKELKSKLHAYQGEKKEEIENYVIEKETAGELTNDLAKRVLKKLESQKK